MLLEERTPRRQFWLLFKVASKERLLQMQQGLLYMNSLEYFSSLQGEEALALRKDELETTYAQFKAGNHLGSFTLQMGNGKSKKSVKLNEDAEITFKFPRPKNTMLFCMGALADDDSGKIPGESNNQFYFDKRFLSFGDSILLITAPMVFSDRINRVLQNEKRAFSSPLMNGGFGLVDYLDLSSYSGSVGLFRKHHTYSWQRELRFAFGVENDALNQKGAYEFNIGNISDISQVLPMNALIEKPLELKRRTFNRTEEGYIQIK